MKDDNIKLPIIEVLFDIDFVPSTKWDITAFGKFHSKIENEYPEKEELQIIRSLTDEDLTEDDNCNPEILMRFKKTDGTRIIQIAENKMILNIIPPYPGWEDLKPDVIRHINNYCEVCKPDKIESLGVRYVNKFITGEKQFNLKSIFKKSDYIPKVLFKNRLPFYAHLEHPLINTSKVEITIGNEIHDKEREVSIIFDLEVMSMEEFEINDEKIENKLEQYHKCLVSVFKNCISEGMKKTIGIAGDKNEMPM